MDFGLDRLIEMFEARFGRKPSNVFFALCAVGIGSAMIHLAWVDFVHPVYLAVKELKIFSTSISLQTLINGGLTVFLTFMVINLIAMSIWFTFGFWKFVIDDWFEKKRQKIWWDKQHAEFLAKYPPVESPAIPALQSLPTETLPQKSLD